MTLNEVLIQRLEASQALMLAYLDRVERDRKIYPMWTIREIIAHLTGWDDSTIAFIRCLQEGGVPETPAERGIDSYNAATVATRQGLDYDHVYREYLSTRRRVIELIRGLPEEALTSVSTLPWGGDGTLVDMVDIFAPHEEEHAEDVRRIIEGAYL